MNTFNLNLDLDKRGGVAQWVTLRQGDHNGTELRATIYDHGTLVGGGYTCRVSIRRPDVAEYYRETCEYASGVATVTIDEQYAAAISGSTYGYFELLQGDAIIASTESFGVRILPDATADATLGPEYDSAIEDALAELDEATGRISQMVVDATEEYLEAHPELTTTVEDNSLTDAKLIQHGGILDRVARLWHRLDNLLTATPAESDALTVTDAAKTPLAGLALYGRSTQAGTPTPSAPVAIQSVTPNLYQQTYYAAGTSRTTVGLNVTYNEDGTCTCTGTATASAWLWGGGSSADDRFYVTLPAGTYTMCGSHYVASQKKVNGTVSTMTNTGKSPVTFTLAETTLVKAVPVIPNGETVTNETAWVAVYAGTEPHPYVPYNNVGLLSCGKNLAKNYGSSVTTNGITFTVNADGSVTADGTATANASFSIATRSSATALYLRDGTYTLSGCPAGGSSNGYELALNTNPSGNVRMHDYGSGASYTFEDGEGMLGCSMYIMIRSGQTMNNMTFRPMLELGSTATPYQPYVESTTPIPLQGHELRSLPDGTRDEVTVDQYGHAVLTQRVGSYTVTGSETIRTGSGAVSGGIYRVEIAIPEAATVGSGQTVNSGLCSKSVYKPAYASSDIHAYVSENLAFLFDSSADTSAVLAAYAGAEIIYPLATPVTIDLGTIDPIALQGPDMTAQAVPTAPFALTYERDLNVTLARLEASIAELATN